MIVITKATSLPHYMNIVIKSKEELSINNEQEKKLNLFKKENTFRSLKIAEEVEVLEKEIYSMSLQNISSKEILSKLSKSLVLRNDLAVLKTDCRNEIKTILTEEQWNGLTKIYRNKMPFNDKTDMMELIIHVNPVPNYMQIIKDKKIELDENQDAKIMEWQGENHSKMMVLANRINELEKNIYNKSLENINIKEIIKHVEEIAITKTKIVTIKTECRDNIFSILNKNQLEILTK